MRRAYRFYEVPAVFDAVSKTNGRANITKVFSPSLMKKLGVSEWCTIEDVVRIFEQTRNSRTLAVYYHGFLVRVLCFYRVRRITNRRVRRKLAEER